MCEDVKEGIRLGRALIAVMGACLFIAMDGVYHIDSALINGSLYKVEKVIEFAAKTIRIVKQNLIWPFCYNIPGITLALSGVLNLMFATERMCVIANSMRLS